MVVRIFYLLQHAERRDDADTGRDSGLTNCSSEAGVATLLAFLLPLLSGVGGGGPATKLAPGAACG